MQRTRIFRNLSKIFVY